MTQILEALPNLIGYSVPTLLVMGGFTLFFLSFFKEMQPAQIKSSRRYGLFIGIIGIVLALIIKPAEPNLQLVPVYTLPTPANDTFPDEIIVAMDTAISPSTSLPVSEPKGSPSVSVSLQTTDTPEPVTNIIPVWAIEENGVRVNISTSGLYKVSYLGDAYAPWPNEQYEGYQGWTTILRIYVNKPVEWGRTDYGLIGPINHNDYLGPGGYYLDKSQAITVSMGDTRTFRLNAGDYLLFVTLDEKGRYSDNQGKVDVGITYLGN